MSVRLIQMPSEETMLASVRRHFPDIDLQNYVINTDGWDHAVLLVNNQYVFRFPLDDDYLEQLSREITILKQLSPLVSVDIPQYEFIPADKQFAGYPMLPGQQLKKAVLDSLPDQEQAIIASQLAAFLTELHTTTANGHTFPGLPAWLLHEDQPELVKNTQKFLPSKLTPAELERVQKILDTTETMLRNPPTQVFIHNDLYSSHILWDSAQQKLGVIDFSDMCMGDPAVDFNELFEYGKNFVEKVYELYQGPKDDAFLQRAWQYQQWTGVFMMTDYFINDKLTWAEARELFNKTI